MPRRRISRWLIVAILLAGSTRTASGEDASEPWITPAERDGFTATPSYDETLAWLERLAGTAPTMDLQTFGRSGLGRELPLVVVSAERAFTPEEARATGKPIVLIQNGIHAGEIAGKDASLILLRELLVEGRYLDVLGELTLLVVPIYNVDGHERVGHSRINQDGPEQGMGFRTTARGLDLNRDYLKLDAEETQALVGSLIATWDPHLLVDDHTTDGADHRIQISYGLDAGPWGDPDVVAWTEALVESVTVRMEAADRPVAPYVFMGDRRHPEEGFRGGWSAARFSTSYMALRGRSSVLVEAHSLKPYETRVRATHDFLAALLQEVAEQPDALVHTCRTADTRTVDAMADPESRPAVALRLQHSDAMRPFLFRTYRYEVLDGTAAGESYVHYGSEPLDMEVPLRDRMEVELAVDAPRGYLVPPQHADLARRLQLHGVEVWSLTADAAVDVEMVRIDEAEFAAAPYQGHQRIEARAWSLVQRPGHPVPAGTFWVPLDQPLARVAMHLLEPCAPDSFFAWGMLATVMERKEYFERYVMEPMAQEMLRADRKLRREFERKLAEDEAFAADSWARLEFFYRRTEHADPDWHVYPIGRVTTPLPASITLQPAAPGP